MDSTPAWRIEGNPRKDIDALIALAEKQLSIVHKMYGATLLEKDASTLQVWIKNILENQRSALDYLACYIVAQHGKPGRYKTYYPLASQGPDFQEVFRLKMRGLWEAPAGLRDDIRDAIEARQPFQAGYEWLGHLAVLTNENKHSRLTPQVSTQTVDVMWGSDEGPLPVGGVGIVFEPTGPVEGNTVEIPENPLVLMTDDGTIIGPLSNTDQEVRVERYGNWRFAGLDMSAIATLDRIQTSLPSLIDEVCHVARL